MNIFGRKNQTHVREPRFAGTWYESNPDKLKEQLDQFLQEAEHDLRIEETESQGDSQETQSITSSVCAIVAPHAGYVFSGRTAASAYLAACRTNPNPGRVFLLGPSHYQAFQGLALSDHKKFRTPLGDLYVDLATVEELASLPLFETMSEVHENEHSLELQLAFIKHLFPRASIVPVIVGALPDVSDVRMAGLILRRQLHPGDLVVVSSDFTHYGPRYNYAPFGTDVVDQVKKLDLEAYQCLDKIDLPGFVDFHSRTGCTICGFYPCAVLLSMLSEDTKTQLLNYRTSRDTGYEDNLNSVSYLAISFSAPVASKAWTISENDDSQELLDDEDKQMLLRISRQVIETFVREKRVMKVSDFSEEASPNLQKCCGVFVTLFKKIPEPILDLGNPRADKELRGCIGYIWPVKSLLESVIDNSVGACSRDYRFSPVQPEELEQLEVEISVLTQPRRVNSAESIEIGKHGIVMYAKGRQSVFLPQVAVEFGWNLEETLVQLSRKAGLQPTEWKKDASFDVFESVMFEEEEFCKS